MRDDRDYFQRRAEDQIYLSEGVRAVLAILAMLGGGFFVLVGSMFLGGSGAKVHTPAVTTLIGLTLLLLGVGSAYAGVRLLLLTSARAHLLGSRGTRIAAGLVAIVGTLDLAGSLFLGNLYISAAGLFAILMAYWLYTSAKRIRD